ncbi:hypothetical protein U1Q18_019521 [Sarracenia purpurea var. burkii]
MSIGALLPPMACWNGLFCGYGLGLDSRNSPIKHYSKFGGSPCEIYEIGLDHLSSRITLHFCIRASSLQHRDGRNNGDVLNFDST